MAQEEAAQPDAQAVQETVPEAEGAEGDAAALEAKDNKLDEEAEALLTELADSQAEVQRMLASQRDTAKELGGLKSKLETELKELQEEAWRLQTFGELEALKRQLNALNNLEADLDAAEAVLDADQDADRLEARAEQFRAAIGGDGAEIAAAEEKAEVSESKGKAEAEPMEDGEAEDDDDIDGEYDPAEIELLQAKLDAELEEMFAALQAVKSEAASVSARKAALEKELKDLVGMQLTDEEAERLAMEQVPEDDSTATSAVVA